jgi:hypothetical protein
MKKRGRKAKITILLFSTALLLCFMFSPLVSSINYPANSTIDLKIPTNATSCNVTIVFPNSTNLIYNKTMSVFNTGFGNYTFNNTILNGEYDYYSPCGSGSIQITQNGDNLSTGTGLIYFLVTLFAFVVFLFVGWIFLSINGENPKDETGYLGITYRKYIKTALFPIVYVTFLWFFNFIIGLSTNYLSLSLYLNTLGFIFGILMGLVYPVIVITIIVEIVLMVKDANISKEYKSLWSNYPK